MNFELNIWRFILSKIEVGQKVVLLTVANASNASPGRTGFKMVIAEDKSTIGTIGGGIMEFDILNDVRKSFQNNIELSFYKTLHHSKAKDEHQSGLICGGFQTIVFKQINSLNRDVVESIISSLESGFNGLLSIKENSLSFSASQTIANGISFSNSSDSWMLEENIGLPNRVYIVGGGHVGLAVSKIMSSLNFYITVFDHRKDVDIISKNKYADKIIITPYNRINEFINEGEKTFVVVVSPSHDGDRDALKSILKMNLKYIGSMGSKRKIKSIFNHLIADGFTEKDLEKINTPIGIKIKAETPAEIAVSIAAEIIDVKNRQNA